MFNKIKRRNEIISVLIEEGLGFLVYELKLATFSFFPRRLRSKLRKKADKDIAKSLVNALQRLGGLFVKGGQFLSTRPDIIPHQFASYLASLQDKGEEVDFSDIEKAVKKNLGKSIDEIFIRFDRKPVSSASIGQVHFAILRDGTKVAVKVKRPNIDKIVKTDLNSLKWVVRKLKKYRPEFDKFNLDEAVDELSRWSNLELDYVYEAKQMNKFYDLLAGSKIALIPKARMNLTTKDVLVMDWMPGDKITKFYRKQGSSRIAQKLVDLAIELYVRHGYFHGDPHPGNIFVSKDGKIIFLDFGIVGHLSENQRRVLANLLMALFSDDCEAYTKEIINLNQGTAKVPYGKFYDSNRKIMDNYKKGKITFIQLAYITALNAIDNKIKLPVDYILVVKSAVTINEVIKSLNPHFSLSKELEGVLKKELRRKRVLMDYMDKAVNLAYGIASSVGLSKKSRTTAKRVAKDVFELIKGVLRKSR